MSMRSPIAASAAFASLALVAVGGAANASSFSATYFAVPEVAGPDFGVCCSSGPATLPVIAPNSALSGGQPVTTLPFASGGVYDQTGSGQMLWWTPSGSTGVSYTGGGPFVLGQINSMYAPNSTGGNDATYFETAVVQGTILGTGAPASITVSADDDALVYVNGLYAGGVPGVHSTEPATINLGALTGTDQIEVFYADRADVGAYLGVYLTGASVVPEPTSWALMLLGAGGLGAALRSSRRKPVTAAA